MRRIDEIRERLSKASPGPWQPSMRSYIPGSHLTQAGSMPHHHATVKEPSWVDAEGHAVLDQDYEDVSMKLGDVTFVQHAPEDIAFLLQELDRLQRPRDSRYRHYQYDDMTWDYMPEEDRPRVILDHEEERVGDVIVLVPAFASEPDLAKVVGISDGKVSLLILEDDE